MHLHTGAVSTDIVEYGFCSNVAGKGALVGVGEGMVDPNGNVTRAQIAVILDRCGLLKK